MRYRDLVRRLQAMVEGDWLSWFQEILTVRRFWGEYHDGEMTL
jgi:hypothetical protein